MDPKANLKEQLRLSRRIQVAYDADENISSNDVIRLADLVLALDKWKRNGGFPPYSPDASEKREG